MERFNKKGTKNSEDFKPTVAPSKIKSKFLNEDEKKIKDRLVSEFYSENCDFIFSQRLGSFHFPDIA